MPLPNPIKLLASLGELPTLGEMSRAGEKKQMEDEISTLITLHDRTSGKFDRANSSRDVGRAIERLEVAGHTFESEKFGIRPNQFPAAGGSIRRSGVVDPSGGYGRRSGNAGVNKSKTVVP